MEMLTVKEISAMWGISERLVRRLCIEGRIPGAVQEYGIWMLPSDAEKPGHKPRTKSKAKMRKPTAPIPSFAKRILRERKSNTHHGMYEYIQINLTYSSNRMGSNRLTRNEVEEIYRTNKISTTFEPVKVDDIIEAINHFSAIRYVIDHIPDKLTHTLIKKIHQMLTYGTYADRRTTISSGEYRTKKSKMGIRARDIVPRLDELIESYENGAVNMELIMDFHARFETIHPFEDYNGRVGRLIMLKECLRHGVDPFIIDDKRRGPYNRGIASWSEDSDLLISVAVEAQKRFQSKMEVCSMIERARSPANK